MRYFAFSIIVLCMLSGALVYGTTDVTSSSQPNITANFNEKAYLLDAYINNSLSTQVPSITADGNLLASLPALAATYNTFVFTPLSALANRMHSISITVRDNASNRATYSYNFTVNNPNKQDLVLLSPEFGGTSDDTIDVVIGSQYPSVCKWYNQSTIIEDPAAFAGKMYSFDSPPGTTHTITDFFSKMGVNGEPANNQKFVFIVTCNLSTNTGQTNLSGDVFSITYVTSPPNIQVILNPPTLIDINKPISTISVQADQDVWCDINGGPSFDQQIIDNYKPTHSITYTDTQVYSDNPYIDLNVTCFNRAGLNSTIPTSLMRKYLQSDLSIAFGSSQLVTTKNNYKFNFTTNKPSSCAAWREGSPVALTASLSNTSFKNSNTINLVEGINNFSVHCNYTATISDYNKQADAVLQVTLDTIEPNIYGINGLSVISCGLNGLHFAINASDSGKESDVDKGISLYKYNLTNKNTGAVILLTTTSTSAQIDLPLPGSEFALINNTNYTLKVGAQDAAGLWNDSYTFYFNATDDNYVSCDHDAPNSWLVQRATLNGTYMAIDCQDYPLNTGSGCQGYYFNSVPCEDSAIGGACSVDCSAAVCPSEGTTCASYNSQSTVKVFDVRSRVCWIARDVKGNNAALQDGVVEMEFDSGNATVLSMPNKYQKPDFPFTFSTANKAYCNLTRTSIYPAIPDNITVWPQKDTSWVLDQTGLGDGEYLYTITCSNGQQIKPTIATDDIIVDGRNPKLDSLSTDGASCGLDKMKFNFSAEDVPGSAGYMSGLGTLSYSINKTTSNTVFVPWTNTSIQGQSEGLVNLDGLNLTEGTQYTIIVRVYDNAGNPSNTSTAQLIGAANNSFRCDSDAPRTGLYIENISGERQISVWCADDIGAVQSGCNSTYWFNTVAPTSNCAINKATTPQYTLGTIHNITAQRNVCWIVKDNNNQEAYESEILDGPVPQTITLISPENGGTASTSTDVAIRTVYPSTCKWALGNRAATQTEFNTIGLLKIFDIIDSEQKLDIINDFFTKAGIIPQPGTPVNFTTTCYDGVSYFNKTFTIEYLNAWPSFIIPITVNPSIISDPYNPNSTITANTDQATVCSSPTENVNLVGNSQYTTAHTLVYTAPLSQIGDVAITIICANRAGETATNTQTITVDYNQPLSIMLPIVQYSKAASYILVYTTNKQARCTLSNASTTISSSTGRTFSSALTLAPGDNNYIITCDTGYSQAKQGTDIIMDNRAPNFTGILSQNNSCGLDNLSFKFNAIDTEPTSGLFVTYNITNSSGISYQGTTDVNKMDVIAPIILTPGQQYTITAKAYDAVGNQGPTQTKTITATDYNYPDCDHTKPQTNLTILDQSPTGTTLTPTCTDSQSGCKDTYYFTAVSPSQSCAVSRAASYTLGSDIQSLEERSNVCWTVSDIAGNENTSSQIVDVPPDPVPLIITLASQSQVTKKSYMFNFTTNKAAYCSAAKQAGSAISSGLTLTPNTITKGVAFSSGTIQLAEGANTIAVSCRARPSDSPTIDNFTIEVDSTSPVITAINAPTTTCSLSNLSFSFVSTSTDIVQYQYNVKDSNGNPVVSGSSEMLDVTIQNNEQNGPFTDGGVYTIYGQALDGFGNPSNMKNVTVTMRSPGNILCDNTAPDTWPVIISGLDDTSVTIECSDASGCKDNFWIRSINGAGASCSLTKSNSYARSMSQPLAFSQPATICWIAEDTAGNDAPVQTADVTINPSPAAITFNSVASTNKNTYVLNFSTDRLATCTAKLDNGNSPLTPGTGIKARNWVSNNPLTWNDGLHNFSVTCTAQQANTQGYQVAVDTTNPVTITPTSLPTTTSSSYQLNFTTDKDAYCVVKRGTTSPTQSPSTTTKARSWTVADSLGNGPNTYNISCKADGSNVPEQLFYTVTADINDPVVTAVVGPQATCTNDTLSFSMQTAPLPSWNSINQYQYTLSGPRGSTSGTSASPDLTIYGSLVDNAIYTLTATAKDAFGRISNSKTATTTVMLPTNLLCDQTPPDTKAHLIYGLDETTVNIECSDASGCKDKFWMNSVQLGAISGCNVSKMNGFVKSISQPIVFSQPATICWIAEDTAGKDSAIQTVDVDVLAATSPTTIKFTSQNISSSTSYKLSFTTDRRSACTAKLDGSNITSLTLGANTVYDWQASLTLSPGAHTINASCSALQQTTPTQEGMQVIVDNAIPTITGISADSQTCGLNRINFTINTNDPSPSSGIANYYYTLADKGTGNPIIQWTPQQSPAVDLQGLGLLPNSVYTLTAAVVDNAGNPSRNSSIDITAKDAGDFSCDNMPPLSWINQQQTPAGTIASVSCSDQWSGCNSTYWYNALLNSSTQACVINTASSTQKHNISDQYNYTQDERVCWVVRDNRGNQAHQQNASVEASPLQTIILVTPQNGGTDNNNTDFIVSTQYPSTCAWARSPTPINNSGQFNLMNVITQRSANSKLHILPNLYSALGITPYQGLSVPMAVTCNDGYNLTGKVFAIVYTTQPANITITSDPNPIVDPTNPTTNITVSADQDVRCTLDEAALGGDFSTTQSTIYTDTPGTPSPYNLTIVCTTRAGISNMFKETISTNYLSNASIKQTSPKIWTTGVYTLQFITDKLAMCSATRNNNDILLTPSSSFPAMAFIARTGETLVDGLNTYVISCYNGLSAIPNVINATVLVDSHPPTISSINTQNNTCSLQQLRFSIVASDQKPSSGMGNYTYSVKEKGSGNNTANGTSANSDISLNVNLKTGSVYTISATVNDIAGNPSNLMSVDVNATAANSTICDHTPPSTTLLQNRTGNVIVLQVTCSDASGCSQNYYFNAATNGTCVVNKTNDMKYTLRVSEQVIREDSDVCWIVSDTAGNDASGSDSIQISTATTTPSGTTGTTLYGVSIANATVNGTDYTDLIEEASVINAIVQGNRITDGILVAGRIDNMVLSNLQITDGILVGNTIPPFGNKTPDTCTNGKKDPDESGVDCGGIICADQEGKLCADNISCTSDKDCLSNYCSSYRCAESSCNDSKQNGQETGVDCGGTCGACKQQYSSCKKNSDCDNGLQCNKGICTTPAEAESPSSTTASLGMFNLLLIVLGALLSLGGTAYVLLYEQPKKPAASAEEIAENMTDEPIATFENTQQEAPAQDQRRAKVSRLKQRQRRSVLMSFETPEELSSMNNVSHKDIEHAFKKFDVDTFTDTTKQLIKDGKVGKKDVAVALADLATHGKADEDAIDDLKKEFGIGENSEKKDK